METPSSSTRRVTRSQTLAALNNTANGSNAIPISRKGEESEKGMSKPRQRKEEKDRSALLDITNDSPITGLATGSSETPLSSVAKRRNNQCKMTPGSGEALLRGTVKTLLQKVEEEAELSKFSMESRPFISLGRFLNSPMGLLAPTPANTPQILGLSVDESVKDDDRIMESPVEDQLMTSQVVLSQTLDGKKAEGVDSEKSMIRSLLLDFSSKSENSESSDCSSVVTYQGREGGGENEIPGEKSFVEDDDASIWSIQVNASTRDDEDEDEVIKEGEAEEETEEEEEEECDYYYNGGYYNEEEGEEDPGLLDEVCTGMSKISMKGDGETTRFKGKHVRFVYNSDDELVEEAEGNCAAEKEESENLESVLRLKGLPTPRGKHLRFLVE
ncbi:hypothetical protein Ancab_003179 [Ancistrocladus abbreviatus]